MDTQAHKCKFFTYHATYTTDDQDSQRKADTGVDPRHYQGGLHLWRTLLWSSCWKMFDQIFLRRQKKLVAEKDYHFTIMLTWNYRLERFRRKVGRTNNKIVFILTSRPGWVHIFSSEFSFCTQSYISFRPGHTLVKKPTSIFLTVLREATVMTPRVSIWLDIIFLRLLGLRTITSV